MVDKIGSRHRRQGGKFAVENKSEIILNLIATILTYMENSLRCYETGRYSVVGMVQERYALVYEGHVNALRTWIGSRRRVWADIVDIHWGILNASSLDDSDEEPVGDGMDTDHIIDIDGSDDD